MQILGGKRILDLSRTRVMGILNVTPDSFSDGGYYNKLSSAIDRTNQMIIEGATIIDIGGESTRPGAYPITEEEELERVIPVVEMLVKRFDIFISIDTSSLIVMREAAIAGANLINDVRSFHTLQSLELAVSSDLAICLVHNSLISFPTLKKNISILKVVNDFFSYQIDRSKKLGIKENKIILDPGFGFGKSIKENLILLKKIEYFHHFNLPLLIGISRKSVIGKVLPYNTLPQERIIGSITCASIAALKGVSIIRVHDVKETMEALYIINALNYLC
ncbi:dihydropteroate synthase [Candidatus Schneideria nysicola]|uniref:dihydropteroate synthase n=1 Tax=Candidatus Schneideria nysicola TaxID=1081631 RepID=UPI001CAA5FF7|nr:dihydropteroate synthase [Candidatus Schneideria nysicola]UAJ65440.1 dihydropteroate synthase [Candidatus Schneideria nysicola]UAJ65969.1 dihydropteroate synthase [Candidatus Schneideria nysicola]